MRANIRWAIMLAIAFGGMMNMAHAQSKTATATIEAQARKGDAQAMAKLAQSYFNGQGRPMSRALALMWQRMAIANSEEEKRFAHMRNGDKFFIQATEHEIAQADALFHKCRSSKLRDCGDDEAAALTTAPSPHARQMIAARAAYDAEDFERLRDIVMPLAEQNFAQAQTWLAIYYDHLRDYPRAYEWFSRAAESNAEASLYLARYYFYGEAGAKTDHARGLDLLRRAADGGIPLAAFLLGQIYATGEFVPKDEAQAVAWFARAADMGQPQAQLRLGLALLVGRGIAEDRVKAREWINRAADQFNPEATDMMAHIYMNGMGTPKDLPRALMFATLAATYAENQNKPELTARIQERIDQLNAVTSTREKIRAKEYVIACHKTGEFCNL